MSLNQYMLVVLLVLVVAPCGAYLSAKAGAFAWFSAKREHFRQVLKEMDKGEGDNGSA